MIVDEALEHCEEVAEENECKNCVEEHRQLAGWLKELKQLREIYDYNAKAYSKYKKKVAGIREV